MSTTRSSSSENPEEISVIDGVLSDVTALSDTVSTSVLAASSMSNVENIIDVSRVNVDASHADSESRIEDSESTDNTEVFHSGIESSCEILIPPSEQPPPTPPPLPPGQASSIRRRVRFSLDTDPEDSTVQSVSSVSETPSEVEQRAIFTTNW